MVTVIKKKHTPFGSSVARFGKITTHPNLDPSGLYSEKYKGCDPCLYHPKRIENLCEATHSRKIDKDPWRYKNELEEWAKNLGYRNQKVLEKLRWDRSIRGPAWTEVHELPKYEAACMNLGFGRTARTTPSKNKVPGPGTYYKTVPFKAPYGPHSTRPTFAREEPCRFVDTLPKWSLAPDRYTIIDKDEIDQKSNKIVSIRGPYDLFSGTRDECPRNHFSTCLKVSSATWPIALKGCLETYKKSHFGTMNKTNRSKPYRGRSALMNLALCPRSPNAPGPTHYEVYKPRVFKEYRFGFNSSYDKPAGYVRTIVWPGVGRYNVATSISVPGHGHRHAFLSKLGRTIGAVIPQPMNSF